MSATEPNDQEIAEGLRQIALTELKHLPVGSVVMFSNCLGYKKMSLWWRFKYWLCGLMFWKR